MKGLFITATDTDIGKTRVTGLIVAALKKRGADVGVFKPLASGAILRNGTLVSEDAEFLMMAAQIDESRRKEVNEVCLKPALTPAVAAKISNVAIHMEDIIENLVKSAKRYEYVLVEGVGGLAAPLWESYLVVDLIKALHLPPLIVSQSGLGAINHTVLSYEYAKRHGVWLRGFIANRYDGKNAGVLEESNLAYIDRLTGMPLLGKTPVFAAGGMTSEGLAAIAEEYLDMQGILRIMEGKAA